MAAAPRSARWFQGLVLALCVLPLAQACGGRSDTEDFLYGPDGSISEGAQSSGTAGTSHLGGTNAAAGTNGTGAVGVGGTQGIGGTIAVGGTTGIAGTPGLGGSAVGGSAPIGGSAVGGSAPIGGTGAAGAPGGPPLTCGNQTCDTSTQLCCAALGGTGCVSKKKGCNGAVLSCTTSADCAGAGVCCLSLTGSADAASSCKPMCNGFGATRDRQLCQQDSDCQFPQRFCTPTVFGVSVCTRRP